MLFRLTAIAFVVFAGTAALQTQSTAQIPGIPKIAPPPPPSEETPEQIKTRLLTLQKDGRATLARLEEPTAESQLPEGITPAALADRRRDLDQMIRAISRTVGLLDQLPGAKESVKNAVIAANSWTSFPDPPPYSVLKLDDLANQREAVLEKEATFKSSIAIFNKSFDDIDRENKGAEESTRHAIDQVEKSPLDRSAKWRLEAARGKHDYLSVRALFVRTNIELLHEQAAATAAQLTLLENQISVVSKKTSFTDEDLASIQKSSDERRAGLRKEIATLRERLKDASTGRTRVKAAFDELNAATDSANPSPELALAAVKLSAAETRVDTLQFISDNLETFEGLEGFIPLAYENRRTLLQSKVAAEREAAHANLELLVSRLQSWETVSANELAAINADLAAQDSNSSTMPADDPRQPALADQRKSLWEKQAFLQRVSQTVTSHRRNIARWLDDHGNERKAAGLFSNLTDSGRPVWTLIKRIWSFEVTKIQTVRMVAGVPQQETQSITLGLIISALTFFIIAYAVASKISRRLLRMIVGRGHVAEAQANTLRNWLMIAVGVGLAITTLQFLKIPLTVFAFLGGALAIGLGFGMQTLIKNFISGIIVLFERKIRVGDVVEIDANTSGKIVEINTRSSVLRSAEGKETLVPNSLFLENRVTNLTLSNRRVRRTFRVGVAYGSSPSQVSTVLKECLERHGLILKEPAPFVTLEDFGSEALVFGLYYWVEMNSKTDSSVVASDVRIMIEKRFSETGIEFPKTQRDQNLMSSEPLRIHLVSPEDEPPSPPVKTLP